MNYQENSEEFFWEKYEKLPDNLKEALFSEENFNIVSEICVKNNIVDEEVKSQIMKYIGKTLMGLLPVREFSIIIELDLNLDALTARNITAEIDRRIFSHLRISLNKVYVENIAENEELSDNTKEEGTENKEQILSKQKTEETTNNTTNPYREPLI
ncbi:MAG: hypothetical protein PHD31_01615 [Candidatus Pacebacteria bacterium]|nr:hypothetical protein [Candidatus Paceibacterota bacterium]